MFSQSDNNSPSIQLLGFMLLMTSLPIADAELGTIPMRPIDIDRLKDQPYKGNNIDWITVIIFMISLIGIVFICRSIKNQPRTMLSENIRRNIRDSLVIEALIQPESKTSEQPETIEEKIKIAQTVMKNIIALEVGIILSSETNEVFFDLREIDPVALLLYPRVSLNDFAVIFYEAIVQQQSSKNSAFHINLDVSNNHKMLGINVDIFKKINFNVVCFEILNKLENTLDDSSLMENKKEKEKKRRIQFADKLAARFKEDYSIEIEFALNVAYNQDNEAKFLLLVFTKDPIGVKVKENSCDVALYDIFKGFQFAAQELKIDKKLIKFDAKNKGIFLPEIIYGNLIDIDKSINNLLTPLDKMINKHLLDKKSEQARIEKLKADEKLVADKLEGQRKEREKQDFTKFNDEIEMRKAQELEELKQKAELLKAKKRERKAGVVSKVHTLEKTKKQTAPKIKELTSEEKIEAKRLYEENVKKYKIEQRAKQDAEKQRKLKAVEEEKRKRENKAKEIKDITEKKAEKIQFQKNWIEDVLMRATQMGVISVSNKLIASEEKNEVTPEQNFKAALALQCNLHKFVCGFIQIQKAFGLKTADLEALFDLRPAMIHMLNSFDKEKIFDYVEGLLKALLTQYDLRSLVKGNGLEVFVDKQRLEELRDLLGLRNQTIQSAMGLNLSFVLVETDLYRSAELYYQQLKSAHINGAAELDKKMENPIFLRRVEREIVPLMMRLWQKSLQQMQDTIKLSGDIFQPIAEEFSPGNLRLSGDLLDLPAAMVLMSMIGELYNAQRRNSINADNSIDRNLKLFLLRCKVIRNTLSHWGNSTSHEIIDTFENQEEGLSQAIRPIFEYEKAIKQYNCQIQTHKFREKSQAGNQNKGGQGIAKTREYAEKPIYTPWEQYMRDACALIPKFNRMPYDSAYPLTTVSRVVAHDTENSPQLPNKLSANRMK